jgi:nicotinamidase-related amidase
MPDRLKLDPSKTALVLIDLQQGIIGMPVGPHSATDVLGRATTLAERFRKVNAPVVLVRVSFGPGGIDALKQPTDTQPNFTRPAGWDQLSPALGNDERDIRITKHQWGAFYGTELDLQLRRRGVQTIVIGGISTNFGVESTARDAYERSYALVFVEDAMAAMSAEAHAFAVTTIFPRLGRVRSTQAVLDALS